MIDLTLASDALLLGSSLRDVLSEDSWVAEMVRTYGHLFLFIGTFLEGESVVLAGGFAAQRGWLGLPGVFLVCFIGSFAGDQFWYYLGRWKGAGVLDRFPKVREKFSRMRKWLGRGEDFAVVASRFVPGTRMATPLLLGAGGYAPWRFAVFNAIGAAIWSLSLGSLGYSIGKAVESVGIERKFQLYILLGLALFGLTWWLLSSIFRRTAAAAKATIAHRHERHAGGDHPAHDPKAKAGSNAAAGADPAAEVPASANPASANPAGANHGARGDAVDVKANAEGANVKVPLGGDRSIHAGGEHGVRGADR
ncbi:MAG: DedA family protein [Phycisphaerales bacterium]|nr:DedA family protein [Phycisphaerales bacterium]